MTFKSHSLYTPKKFMELFTPMPQISNIFSILSQYDALITQITLIKFMMFGTPTYSVEVRKSFSRLINLSSSICSVRRLKNKLVIGKENYKENIVWQLSKFSKQKCRHKKMFSSVHHNLFYATD